MNPDKLSYSSPKKDFVKFIQAFDASSQCDDEETIRLLAGEKDFHGFHGAVIISGDKAYKINPKIYANNINDPKVLYLTTVYLQTILCLVIDSIIQSKYPELSNTYIKLLDFYKCESSAVSVYEACNLGTVEMLIRDNLCDPAMLDYQLVRSIYQMAQIVGVLRMDHGFIHNDLKTNNVLVHKAEGSKVIDFKMADFDSSTIKLDNVVLRPDRHSIAEKGQSTTNRGKKFYIINRQASVEESKEIDIEGKIFRGASHKKVNIDIYTYMLSILFTKGFKDVIAEMPMFNYLYSKVFKERDITLLSNTLHNVKWLPNGIYGPIHYIITRKIMLRHDIFNHIERSIIEIEKEFDISLS